MNYHQVLSFPIFLIVALISQYTLHYWYTTTKTVKETKKLQMEDEFLLLRSIKCFNGNDSFCTHVHTIQGSRATQSRVDYRNVRGRSN